MRRTPILSVILAATVAAGAVAGTGLAARPGSAAKPIVAKIKGFGPKTATVPRGALIRWRNADGRPHNAVALRKIRGRSAFTTGAPVTRDFRARAPRRRGTYRYICSVHPLTMKGTIVVR